MADDPQEIRRAALCAARAMFDWLAPGSSPADMAAAEDWLLDLERWNSGAMPPPPGDWEILPEFE